MGSHLRFITEWTLDAPIDRVWAVLKEPETYPRWWPGFESVRRVSGNGGVGTVTEHLVNVGMGLRLHFRMTVEEEKPPEFARVAVEGDSVGVTEWRLRPSGDRTQVAHIWDVEVRRRPLRAISAMPGAYAFFKRRHDATMRAGRGNLERLLRPQEP